MNNYLITLFSNMLLRPTFENTVPLQPPPPPLQTVFHVCTYELQFCSCKLESQCTFLPIGMARSTTIDKESWCTFSIGGYLSMSVKKKEYRISSDSFRPSIVSFLEQYPHLYVLLQKVQYTRLNSKKNSFRGNYMRKYGIQNVDKTTLCYTRVTLATASSCKLQN